MKMIKEKIHETTNHLKVVCFSSGRDVPGPAAFFERKEK